MNHGAYAIRRILLLIPTLLAIYTLTFLLIHATPGSPWSSGDKPVHPVVLERLNAAYGLDEPLWKQYVSYLWGRAAR
jgi:oligopeptide transport system permease protein